MISGTGRDRAFLTEMVYGVVRRRRTLEWIAQQCSDRTPAPASLPALILGIHQLLFMDGVPDYAAVNDTVGALRLTTRNRGRVSYVNAILRRVARERDQLISHLSAQPVAIRESHPDGLVQRWTGTYGADACERLCQWNNTRPGIVLRPRPGPAALDAYARRLAEAGIAFAKHPHRQTEFLAIDHGTSVADLPGFRSGVCAIQDPATATAIDLLDTQQGHRVLDACAAPGGKAALIADRMGSGTGIVACDMHSDRLVLLKETLSRLQLDEIEIVQADLREDALPASLTETPFDRILVDVPCSNTGVLRRRPDARWRFDPERLARTVSLQRALLDRTAQLLKPGGRLVYSTCSLEPEENQAQIAAWLDKNGRFSLLKERTLFPPDTQTDGAYAAAFVLE